MCASWLTELRPHFICLSGAFDTLDRSAGPRLATGSLQHRFQVKESGVPVWWQLALQHRPLSQPPYHLSERRYGGTQHARRASNVAWTIWLDELYRISMQQSICKVVIFLEQQLFIIFVIFNYTHVHVLMEARDQRCSVPWSWSHSGSELANMHSGNSSPFSSRALNSWASLQPLE